MGEWIDTTIGEQVTLQRGIDITRLEQRPGVVPVISSGGVSSHHDTAGASGPGVILGRKGVVGSVYYVESDYWPHDTTLWVKDFHGNQPRFIYYFFLSIAARLATLDVGTANPTLNRNHVHPIKIKWPAARKEQHSIASTLGALDDKIDFIRRMNRTLEAMARAIFKDWFVDFGPTRAKVEGRSPYLADSIWNLFPDQLDEHNKPVGWDSVTLADFAVMNPESWSRATYPESIEYVDLSNTKWGTIEITTPYSREAAPSRAQRVLRAGDTIVGTVRPGNGSHAFVSADGMTGSTGFAVLRPKDTRLRELVYLASTARENIDRLSRLADGGAYPAVSPELVIGTELVSAPQSLCNEFGALTGALLDLAEANKREMVTLATTRDFLLPKLMSGAVTVKDVDKAVGKAT
jgi:type I restriction enzyme S subunit